MSSSATTQTKDHGQPLLEKPGATRMIMRNRGYHPSESTRGAWESGREYKSSKGSFSSNHRDEMVAAPIYDFFSKEVHRCCRNRYTCKGREVCHKETGKLHAGDEGYIPSHRVRCPRRESCDYGRRCYYLVGGNKRDNTSGHSHSPKHRVDTIAPRIYYSLNSLEVRRCCHNKLSCQGPEVCRRRTGKLHEDDPGFIPTKMVRCPRDRTCNYGDRCVYYHHGRDLQVGGGKHRAATSYNRSAPPSRSSSSPPNWTSNAHKSAPVKRTFMESAGSDPGANTDDKNKKLRASLEEHCPILGRNTQIGPADTATARRTTATVTDKAASPTNSHKFYDIKSPEAQLSCRRCRPGTIQPGCCAMLHPGDLGYVERKFIYCPHGNGTCTPARVGRCPFYHESTRDSTSSSSYQGSQRLPEGGAQTVPAGDKRVGEGIAGEVSATTSGPCCEEESSQPPPLVRGGEPSGAVDQEIPLCRWGKACPYYPLGVCWCRHDNETERALEAPKYPMYSRTSDNKLVITI